MTETTHRPVVIITPVPCERSASMTFAPNGDLRAVEIDGVYYACTRRKRTTLHRPGDQHVTLVVALTRRQSA